MVQYVDGYGIFLGLVGSVLTLSTTCITTKIFQTGLESEMKNKPKDVTLGEAVKNSISSIS